MALPALALLIRLIIRRSAILLNIQLLDVNMILINYDILFILIIGCPAIRRHGRIHRLVGLPILNMIWYLLRHHNTRRRQLFIRVRVQIIKEVPYVRIDEIEYLAFFFIRHAGN